MSRLIGVGVAAAVLFAVWHWRSTSPPSAVRVEPLLRDYLVSGTAGNCSGTMTLEQLDEVSVGEFSSQFGGWPVYANHRETCRSGQSNMTYDGSQDATRNVAAAFVKRTMTGRLEVYTPAMFAEAQREMQQSLQKAFDSVGNK